MKYILKCFECLGNFVCSFYVVGLTFVVEFSLKKYGFKCLGGSVERVPCAVGIFNLFLYFGCVF